MPKASSTSTSWTEKYFLASALASLSSLPYTSASAQPTTSLNGEHARGCTYSGQLVLMRNFTASNTRIHGATDGRTDARPRGDSDSYASHARGTETNPCSRKGLSSAGDAAPRVRTYRCMHAGVSTYVKQADDMIPLDDHAHHAIQLRRPLGLRPPAGLLPHIYVP
jgi:hypothetical protein